MISHKKKLIFIHIPKTAGTSIEDAIVDESSICKKNEWNKKIRTTPLNHLTLQEMIEHGFIDLPTAKSYFKFCFVRNPWSRVVSEISFMASVFSGDTFSEKVASLCGMKSYGNHVRPQIDFIENEYGIEMDMIGRFESLDEDFRRICEIIGLSRDMTLPHSNRSKHDDYQSYFNDQTKKMVATKYREDIERFNYRF